MSIETLDDIVEQIADRLGVYDSCDDEKCGWKSVCRCCFTSSLKERIRDAVRIEDVLEKHCKDWQ